jgi:hypothetical protein
MLYLIDTTNGKRQLLRYPQLAPCGFDWFLRLDSKGFVDCPWKDKITVMTYYQFGILVEQYPALTSYFELIVCDEIHNTIYFGNINPKEVNHTKIAKVHLNYMARDSNLMIVGMTATPRMVKEKYWCPIKRIKVDEDVIRYEEKERIPFPNINNLLTQLDKNKIGILYTTSITDIKKFVRITQEMGFNSIGIWSIHNTDHPMNDEQYALRNYIIEEEKILPQYNLVFINASFETGINIYNTLFYWVLEN